MLFSEYSQPQEPADEAGFCFLCEPDILSSIFNCSIF